MYTLTTKSLTGTLLNALALICSVQAVNPRSMKVRLHRRQTQVTGSVTYDDVGTPRI